MTIFFWSDFRVNSYPAPSSMNLCKHSTQQLMIKLVFSAIETLRSSIPLQMFVKSYKRMIAFIQVIINGKNLI